MSNPLDTKVISKLAEILDKSNLTELEYEDEGCRICLTRDFSGRIAGPAAAPMPAPMAPLPPVPAPVPSLHRLRPLPRLFLPKKIMPSFPAASNRRW